MSRKPENTFRGSVHKHLPSDLYKVKMNNPFAAGLPDDYYSGSKADLWVEYKFIEKIIPSLCSLPNLSSLQLQWLNDRFDEGRNVAVIVGCKEGGVLYQNRNWLKPVTAQQFSEMLKTRIELARWITHFTGGGP